ncbi:MAG TPA: serine hydrolase [Candidatus Saccharimonadales bacterium]|nr:serine hydrolase [Candidatus Saccharimonadales bacterium]
MVKHSRVRRTLLSLLVVLLCGSYVAYTLTQPLAALAPRVTFRGSRPAAAVALDWPVYGESAVGAVGYGVLTTHGAETPLPTASTIKVLTALAVLQRQPLTSGQQGPAITITAADVASYTKYVAEDGSVVRVVAGEQLSEYQALQALLLPSANNIAETLARWAFGSIAAYTTYANTYARQLGMTSTAVTDPSGFLSSTTSTPRDLTLLGEAALANPVLAAIVAQPSAIIPVQGTIYNVNFLLGQEGLIGIKTGNNDDDLGCFLFAATRPVGSRSVTIVGAIMDAPNLNTALTDALPLIRSAAGSFSDVTVIRAGDQIGTYQSPWQGTIRAVAAKTQSALLWNGAALTTTTVLHTVDIPAKSQQAVGTLTIKNAATSGVTTVPVVLAHAAGTPGILWRLTHPFDL